MKYKYNILVVLNTNNLEDFIANKTLEHESTKLFNKINEELQNLKQD